METLYKIVNYSDMNPIQKTKLQFYSQPYRDTVCQMLDLWLQYQARQVIYSTIACKDTLLQRMYGHAAHNCWFLNYYWSKPNTYYFVVLIQVMKGYFPPYIISKGLIFELYKLFNYLINFIYFIFHLYNNNNQCNC